MENNLTQEQAIEKISAMFNEKTATLPTIESVNELKLQIDSLKSFEKKTQEIEVALAKFEGKVEAMTERIVTPIEEKVGSLGDQVTKAYMSKLEDLKSGKSINITTKDTTINGDFTGSVALSTLEAGVSHVARQVNKLRNFMNVGQTASKFVTYIQETSGYIAGGTFLTEADAKSEFELKWAEVSKEVKKVAGFIKVSKEMLEDLTFVRNEINFELTEGIEGAIENQLLNGTGVGVNLSGIYTTATTWVAGTFALQVYKPNLSDVLATAIAQIQGAKHNATHIILHPSDWTKLSMTKDVNGNYTYGSFSVNAPIGAVTICGLPVLTTTYMTAGQFLVADMSKAYVRQRNDMNITIGYTGDDFARNMVTILAEARLVSFVKANDLTAFVKGDINSCITALTKV